jgi:hypothetical protein
LTQLGLCTTGHEGRKVNRIQIDLDEGSLDVGLELQDVGVVIDPALAGDREGDRCRARKQVGPVLRNQEVVTIE